MTALRGWLALAAVVLVGAAAVVLVNGYHERKADQAYQESLVLKGQVDALQEQAREHNAAADRLAQTVSGQDQTILALKAKLARAQRPALPAQPGVPDPVGVVDPGPESPDALKDQVITAQDQQIGTLKAEVVELRAALVLKDRALGISEQRARGLEIALDAQRHAAKSGKWIGRLQGFAIGLGAGYVSGRLK
jgi:hypothetical protein